jgi:hypothetical protein
VELARAAPWGAAHDRYSFLVSTEIAGSPAAWNAFTSGLMCSNWVLRSGWLAPSGVLLLAYRLKAGRRSKRPTSFWRAVKPRSASAADRRRWLLLTHNKAASGSPRIIPLHRWPIVDEAVRGAISTGLAESNSTA